ncbi:hypothetical protein [Leuconostoc carnosum]|uniref:hypothetical protein n=2 Tax=Leuconostoc carnosum TaxID=1252 RepID=UPI00168136C2|nr:hypothetical protein [Leuconostoc carnosum]
MICKLTYRICTNTRTSENAFYNDIPNSQFPELNDNYSMNDGILSFDDLNIKISGTVLRHKKEQILFWKTKLFKNQFLISEMNGTFTANILIMGTPNDIYSIRNKIFNIIGQVKTKII